MGKHHHKFSEADLHKAGFTQGPDGSWSKTGSVPSDPASRSDSQPAQKKKSPRHSDKSKRPPDVRYVALITVKTVKPRDYDGLGAASKHYMDALQSLEIFPDDSPDHLEVFACSESVRTFAEEETIIEVFKLPKESKIQ